MLLILIFESSSPRKKLYLNKKRHFTIITFIIILFNICMMQLMPLFIEILQHLISLRQKNLIKRLI